MTDKLPIDDSVTAEYLAWLESNHPMHGLGGNVAWNAGVAFGKSQAVREAVPEGFVLVPVEPTEAMLKAAHSLPDVFSLGDEYKAMIAAAKEAK